MISGDEIIKIEAILSGTISYIFNNYVGERTFEEVVREAQELGYTEPDPRDDLNGLDFSRKMLILARENGLPLELSDVNISSFLPEACLNANSVEDFYKELKTVNLILHHTKSRRLKKIKTKVNWYFGK